MNEFWITNVSKRNVTIRDLALSIPAHTSLNLLKPGRYSYTLDQLIQSAKNGSLYNKRRIIRVRQVAPQKKEKKTLGIASEVVSPSRYKTWSQQKIYEESYEELRQLSDEEFIDQMTAEDE